MKNLEKLSQAFEWSSLHLKESREQAEEQGNNLLALLLAELQEDYRKLNSRLAAIVYAANKGK